MEIIKLGRNPKPISAIRRFKCTYCGCVFEADKNEYECGSQYSDFYYSCKCPCCGQHAGEVVMRGAEE